MAASIDEELSQIERDVRTLKESGTQQRHFGAAAKAIEAERARLAASRPPAASAPASTAAASSGARSVAVAERKITEAYTASFADPERETEKVQQLYQKLIEARTETGEKAGAPNL